MTLHVDDAAMIRGFAIKQARGYVQVGGSEAMEATRAWAGVAVLAGADAGDLAVALGLLEGFVQEGVDLVRGVRA